MEPIQILVLFWAGLSGVSMVWGIVGLRPVYLVAGAIHLLIALRVFEYIVKFSAAAQGSHIWHG